MSKREIELEVFHEDMTSERVKMIARVQAKRESKGQTLAFKAIRRFKYPEVK